ncbi:hypothetical protein ACFQ08_45255 [Streptosporangium algeriense]|uniref:Alpha/beta hydrolase n=1 Tax=Streptosporangium algeriense TaxID=1682748 RepID=A0ABW3E6M1_9ACTN
MTDRHWLHPPRTEPGPALICIPVAGAPYWSFRSWYATPSRPSVHVLSLPGRGRRVREPSYADMAELVRDAAAAFVSPGLIW